MLKQFFFIIYNLMWYHEEKKLMVLRDFLSKVKMGDETFSELMGKDFMAFLYLLRGEKEGKL